MHGSELHPNSLATLAVVDRGGLLESRHLGVFVVVGEEGEWVVGDASQPVFVRSAVKPFQALPSLERGMVAELGLSAAEIAIQSASHDGEEGHVEVVAQLLAKQGLNEEYLVCGPHAPFAAHARRALGRAGKKFTRLHNNCSGKHAGFLYLASKQNADLKSYLDPRLGTQVEVRSAVQDMLGAEAEGFDLALDGCGAPTFRVPLRALAHGFRRLMNQEGLTDVRVEACQTLRTAVSDTPFYLAGEKRLCTALIRSAPGAIYPKNGAEGVYACGFEVNGRSYGLAVKSVDGNERGYFPAVIDALHKLGLWQDIPEDLHRFAVPVVLNTLKAPVGHVRSALPSEPEFRQA